MKVVKPMIDNRQTNKLNRLIETSSLVLAYHLPNPTSMTTKTSLGQYPQRTSFLYRILRLKALLAMPPALQLVLQLALLLVLQLALLLTQLLALLLAVQLTVQATINIHQTEVRPVQDHSQKLIRFLQKKEKS